MTSPRITARVDQETALLREMLARLGVRSVDVAAQRLAGLIYDRLTITALDDEMSDLEVRYQVHLICLALDEIFQLGR